MFREDLFGREAGGSNFVPITLSTTLLLDGCRISVDMARLSEVSRKVVFSGSSAVCKTGVVSVVAFLGSSHLEDEV